MNGDLFRDTLRMPDFDSAMRGLLIKACKFDWSGISPAIFGALFQSVMDKQQRREQGAHYTTEQNILKVIEPLFLRDLRAEFERLKARKDSRRRMELKAFHKQLKTLTFFDPACGCGNFLIIAYRELRLLEMEVIRILRSYRSDEKQLELDAAALSLVDVDQFYGIEIGEFPARIAETAMWMMDHIMNNRLSLEFGQNFARIPLKKSPHIRQGDALEEDWETLLPPARCAYILGNPPFVGAKKQTQTQRAQVHRIADLGKSGGTLDYVAAWFIKAGEYAQARNIPIGFVATNSITQGEQVAQLWPLIFERCKLDISFAHRPFAWGSDARGKAQVHVVIIGLANAQYAPKVRRLFSYDDSSGELYESQHAALSPYLFDASKLLDPHLVVRRTSKLLNGLQKLVIGSKPIDDGQFIFTDKERDEFLAAEPGAAQFLRPYVGSQEFLNGGDRWILALHDAPPSILSTLPRVKERIAKVREVRLKSDSKPTKALAATPTLYHINVIPTAPFLVVPRVSSEKREYAPIGWLNPPTVPSDAVTILLNATKPVFALLTSTMHMTWLRYIGGRLGNGYRYSIGIVYNTFPLPLVSDSDLTKLELQAEAVLNARADHPKATLANLYDPDTMPSNLRKAHQAVDRAVDRLYRKSGFDSDCERVEHLLGLYEKMAMPLTAATKKKPARRSTARRSTTAGSAGRSA